MHQRVRGSMRSGPAPLCVQVMKDNDSIKLAKVEALRPLLPVGVVEDAALPAGVALERRVARPLLVQLHALPQRILLRLLAPARLSVSFRAPLCGCRCRTTADASADACRLCLVLPCEAYVEPACAVPLFAAEWSSTDLSSRSRSRWSRRSSGTVAVCWRGCNAAAADAAAPDCSAAFAACASRCGRSAVAETTTAAASMRRCRCCARSDGDFPEKNVLWRGPCCSCCNLQRRHNTWLSWERCGRRTCWYSWWLPQQTARLQHNGAVDLGAWCLRDRHVNRRPQLVALRLHERRREIRHLLGPQAPLHRLETALFRTGNGCTCPDSKAAVRLGHCTLDQKPPLCHITLVQPSL